ncbi:MAG: SdiA-regulated domain-containing protein [Methylophilus sp.]|nr:SdiA-regulated domain-containing protein [Methylophilus sp.]
MKFRITIVISLILVLFFSAAYYFRLEAIGWYFWHNAQSSREAHALDLKNYHVIIDGLAIKGLKNASDLTFNADTNTLFTVLNQESKIIELSLDGKVLRSIHVDGVDDMEGVTHLYDNHFVIADERDSRLVLIELPRNVNLVDATHAPKIRLGINDRGNKNFEGLSWDGRKQRLLVVKERDPKYMISVKGLVEGRVNQSLHLDIEKLSKYDNMLNLAMRDLSAVHYISRSGHTLLLSEESKLVKEFDENAKPLGALSLWKGFHGLKSNIPQAEGITLDNHGNLYIISEPNLLYVFRHQ